MHRHPVMQSGSYVVHLVGSDDPNPFKQFGEQTDAVNHGRNSVQEGKAERADVFFVGDTTNAPATIAAVQKGEATYIQSYSRHGFRLRNRGR
jgi:hypothetical protein